MMNIDKHEIVIDIIKSAVCNPVFENPSDKELSSAGSMKVAHIGANEAVNRYIISNNINCDDSVKLEIVNLLSSTVESYIDSIVHHYSKVGEFIES